MRRFQTILFFFFNLKKSNPLSFTYINDISRPFSGCYHSFKKTFPRAVFIPTLLIATKQYSLSFSKRFSKKPTNHQQRHKKCQYFGYLYFVFEKVYNFGMPFPLRAWYNILHDITIESAWKWVCCVVCLLLVDIFISTIKLSF